MANDSAEEQGRLLNIAVFRPVILDPTVEHTQRTVIVLGLMRGGTSMVAAALDALGVYMGPEKEMRGSGSFENYQLRGTQPEFQDEVTRCNANHDLWGWKNVPGWSVLETRMLDGLRNLHGVFVYRDPFAVAQRRKRESERRPQDAAASMVELLADVLDQYSRLTKAISREGMRRMIVSYQHSLQRPAILVEGLCNFLGLTPKVEQITEAIQRILPMGGYFQRPDIKRGK